MKSILQPINSIGSAKLEPQSLPVFCMNEVVDDQYFYYMILISNNQSGIRYTLGCMYTFSESIYNELLIMILVCSDINEM